MSQYPQPPVPPPGYPPQGGYPPQYPPQGGYPPPGYPPQGPGQYPPQGQYSGQPAPGNPAAVTALVMGLLLCIPFLTGLGGVIFGIVGVKKTRDPRVQGKGLAIAGIVLGILNLAVYGLFGGAIWAMVAGTETQRTMAKQFIQDMTDGKVDAAYAVCAPNITKPELLIKSLAMKSQGAIKDMTAVGIKSDMSSSSNTKVGVGVVVEYQKGTRQQYEILFEKDSTGAWKITGMQ